jgi:phage gp29-like protein
MSFIDRFAALIENAGSMISRVGAAIHSPMPPNANVAPTVDLPGVPQWGSFPANTSERVRQSLASVDAYFGRVSYDAGPSWSRFSSYPANDLTPEKIAGAQQEAVAGYPLRWTEMTEQILSRDAHLAGIGQQRVDDVIKGSWRLVRSVKDDLGDAVRSFCNEALRGVDELEDAFAWLLWGNAYSYSATETTWKRARMTWPGPRGETLGPIDVIVPARIDAVHAKHFRFDLRTDEPLLWLGSDQVSLPFGKFQFFRGEGHHPITERRGYMWQCAWLSMFKSIGWAGWAVYVERFGLPTPLVEYDGELGQYTEYKQVFQDILNNLGRGYGAIIPKNNVTVDQLKFDGGGRASDPHSALSDACDAGQSIRVLGATLTAKIGNVGSFAASSTHADVKYAREEADARRLWSVLRPQLLAPIAYINAEAIATAMRAAGYAATPDMVVRRVPRGLHRVPREIDPLQRGQLVSMAMNEWGLRIGAESLYDEFNLPQPTDDSDVAPGAPQQVTSGGKVVGSVEAAIEGAEAPKEDADTATPTEPAKQLPAANEEEPGDG